MRRVALVTCEAFPNLHPREQPLVGRFAQEGIEAVPVVWSDPAVDFAAFERVVIRATWDYFERPVEFFGWLDRMEAARVPLYNPPALVRWNADKRYLRDLEQRQVRVVPTRFIEAHQPCDLAAQLRELDWSRVVIKPAVSAGAWRTHLLGVEEAGAHQSDLDEILASSAVLIQPFLPEITDEGEWSMFFFGGAFSHAILKTPVAGDFRSQPMFGASFKLVTPPPSMMRAAEGVLGKLPVAPLYARVDGVRRGDDFLLMEVELIEPYLFLTADPGAIDRYVRAVATC
jgi:glutathione synthase/RimK-type ligase-like ATP-grasp enzyme